MIATAQMAALRMMGIGSYDKVDKFLRHARSLA